MMLVTLREDGEIVGYFIGFVAPGLHYKTCLTLTMDIFYVLPEHRGSGGGVILFKAVEKEARTARCPAHVRRLEDAQGCELPV
jgi:GNAT superfamily N-acetyltransferase